LNVATAFGRAVLDLSFWFLPSQSVKTRSEKERDVWAGRRPAQTSLKITSYAVGVWGRLAAPEDLLVSPMQGDKVALHGRKRTILGGFATLQTSPQQATA
jgi:hypothetical protein